MKRVKTPVLPAGASETRAAQQSALSEVACTPRTSLAKSCELSLQRRAVLVPSARRVQLLFQLIVLLLEPRLCEAKPAT